MAWGAAAWTGGQLVPAALGLLALLAAVPGVASAAQTDVEHGRAAPGESDPGVGMPVTRIIVGLRPEVGAARTAPEGGVHALAWRSRLASGARRAIGPALELVELEQPVSGSELADVLASLQADPAVAFAEPDRRVRRHALPNDALYPGQWYLQGNAPAAIDVESAWDTNTGSAGIVVALLDTGVRFDHPDLGRAGRGGRLLPGYDFVSNPRIANDGDGWDPDPADPGDWVTDSDIRLPEFSGCEVEDSSWHGTRVAGLVAARTNNGSGIAGATWAGWILPVRVLGKCSGYDSDILQAMRWAAGLHVDDVPDNRYPARVLNMSLGGSGGCTQGYQTVIEELRTRGVVVVASAGNSGAAVEYPAVCPGVVAVAGLRHAGTKVGYSNLGHEVAVAAPAGNCVNLTGGPCLYSLDTTVDRGTRGPAGADYTDQINANFGTSFSAPQVSAIAALMQAVNGNLGVAQVTARLRASARPFPAPQPGIPWCHVPDGSTDIQEAECGCTTSTCGAGMVYAPGAVAEALRPIAAVRLPATVSPGQDVRLDATGSAAACGRAIAAYHWLPLDGAPVISGDEGAVATLQAPGSGTVSLRLTVTDDRGRTDSADIEVGSAVASSGAPASAGNRACPVEIVPVVAPPSAGGGGGGALDWTGLLVLLVAALARRHQEPRGRPGLRTSMYQVALLAPEPCPGSGCGRR